MLACKYCRAYESTESPQRLNILQYSQSVFAIEIEIVSYYGGFKVRFLFPKF